MTHPTETSREPSWPDLLRRWDEQQRVYVEERERAYTVMFSVLDALLPPDLAGGAGGLVALDLASGPGSLSRRLLDHRQDSRCVAVDVDPVLLTVGRGALGDAGGRLRWVAADLREPGWTGRLGETTVDAVLSSTALHYLDAATLAAVYRSLADLVRPGGVLMDFDGFPSAHPGSRLDAATAAVDRARQERAVAGGTPAWQDWWDEARGVPALAAAFAERDRVLAPAQGRIFPHRQDRGERKRGTSLAFHEAALVEAGFAEAGVVWQDLHKRVLVAVR